MTSTPSIFEYVNPSGKKVYKIEAVIGSKNGRRVRTRRTAHSLAEAKRIRQELSAMSFSGDLQIKTSVTVNDFGEYFISSAKSGRIKESTKADYLVRLARHIRPYLGRIKIASLSAGEINSWMAQLKREGYSVSTINSARRMLHAICKQAVREEVINRNPVELTDSYRRLIGDYSSVRPPWSEQEVLRALAASRNSEFDLFLHIALLTGLRRGEILGLQWRDIDIDNGQIHINGTLKELRRVLPSGDGLIELMKDTPKTAASNRTVGLPWPVAEAIMRHRELQKRRQKSAAKWQETSWVFTSDVGSAVYPSNFLTAYKKFLEHKGLRYIRIHDLRHTMAQLALAKGIRIEGVSETLGHTRIDTTKTIYAARVLQLALDTPHLLAESLLSLELKDERSFNLDQSRWADNQTGPE